VTATLTLDLTTTATFAGFRIWTILF